MEANIDFTNNASLQVASMAKAVEDNFRIYIMGGGCSGFSLSLIHISEPTRPY